ncbi:long-chain-fatty-acid--CoA ligase [Rhodococcus sp. NPDC127528]|uniref:long-chain-fatty-acid--CoA ligase n=1 Tax=unclassified Rhodococcus (in: high G+C Gram-positive bacteria) TaxID=192944 RepID=UPI003631AB4C
MYLTQSLHRALQQEPDRIATIFGDRVRTVAESVDRIARLGGALRSLGVRAGDRVAFLGLNSDRYHEYLFAVPWIGGVVNPVNIRWSAAEIAFSLTDSGTRVLMVDDEFAEVVPALRDRCDGVETVIFAGEREAPPGALRYEELIEASAPVEDTRTSDDSLLGLFYTGGTTGRPKGVMVSHRNLVTSGLGSLATGCVASPGGRVLHVAPMFHMADIAMWAVGNLAASTHVVIPAFTPDGTVKAIAEHGITDALLVPTMIQMLVEHAEDADVDLTSVEHFVYGASPISESLLARARTMFPTAQFTQAYGMTELSPITTLLSPADHDDPTLQRAAGRAVPHAEVRIVDADDNEVPRGTVGEVVARGDHVMRGYWNMPKDTAEALRGGWMHTGDGGYMDENGYVFIVDRLKDMIITGGENVYSVEVENALAKHPAVAACAVIGVPDERWGERVHAVIVTTPGGHASSDELRAHCRALIGSYKVPRSIEFVDALPVSGAGKILKRALRTPYSAATANGA